MNVQFRPDPSVSVSVKTAIADCDIHPARATSDELYPLMAKRWHSYLETYGKQAYHGMMDGPPYPKAQPNASRRDAWPPEGGPQGSSLSFMQKQLLDPYNVALGVLNPLNSGQGLRNHDFAGAICTAINDWQIEKWTSKDSRLKGSIVVANEDSVAAAAEIRKRAGDKNFVQVLLLSRNVEPLGQRRYWPIYEAAEEAGLPVGIHAFGYSGWPMSSSGYPSFYIEEMTEHATSAQVMVTSMIMEGIFERLPELKVVLIECGFGWLPALGWRLDKQWKRLKDEVPHLKMAPSEYIKKHFWVTTQPMEETENPDHLLEVMNWIGMDRIMFSSDYPHWDFDDPFVSLPPSLTDEQRRKIYSGNARALYRLD
jgi:predicted TIM-barrel fold metal-dependent hydrolase